MDDEELLHLEPEVQDVVVTRASAAGVTVQQLARDHARGCTILGVRRLGVTLPSDPSLELCKGDTIRTVAITRRMKEFADRVGHVDRATEETDLLTFCLGIAAGILIGSFSVTIGNIPLGLGMAGGLLVSGLVIGYLRALHPTFGRIPLAARWVFMELGLMLFMACVGLNAGDGIVEALRTAGPVIFLCGIAVTLTPVLIGYLFGKRVLGLNPVVLLGAITGSMTSTPALSAVNRAAKSQIPALGYTGAYAFANILLTLAGMLIMRV